MTRLDPRDVLDLARDIHAALRWRRAWRDPWRWRWPALVVLAALAVVVVVVVMGGFRG